MRNAPSAQLVLEGLDLAPRQATPPARPTRDAASPPPAPRRSMIEHCNRLLEELDRVEAERQRRGDSLAELFLAAERRFEEEQARANGRRRRAR
ncbi:MAG: hypothetical protein U0271_36980 [Polyangiaceae bacterium]